MILEDKCLGCYIAMKDYRLPILGCKDCPIEKE